MNTSNDTPQNMMTLEKICQLKSEKLAEIRTSKQRITETARQIFRPNESTTKPHTLMNNFHSGIAIFNGVMTGFKIMKRIRNLFYHR
jgi:hypothetical protein